MKAAVSQSYRIKPTDRDSYPHFEPRACVGVTFEPLAALVKWGQQDSYPVQGTFYSVDAQVLCSWPSQGCEKCQVPVVGVQCLETENLIHYFFRVSNPPPPFFMQQTEVLDSQRMLGWPLHQLALVIVFFARKILYLFSTYKVFTEGLLSILQCICKVCMV